MSKQIITRKSDNIELVLLGIDKVWVKAKNGQWRIKKEVVNDHSNNTENFELEDAPRKWWKFWKK